MPFVMHRVFCSTPGDLEEERQAFYNVMSEINESAAMPRGILFVAVALPGSTCDKRPYQAAISENVRACRYYVQVLEDTWGPPERNFERDYVLATKCVEDSSLPMRDVAVLFKKPLVPDQVDQRVTDLKRLLETENGRPHYNYSDIAEFKIRLREQLSGWLQTINV